MMDYQLYTTPTNHSIRPTSAMCVDASSWCISLKRSRLRAAAHNRNGAVHGAGQRNLSAMHQGRTGPLALWRAAVSISDADVQYFSPLNLSILGFCEAERERFRVVSV